jgi:hypothetical protein
MPGKGMRERIDGGKVAVMASTEPLIVRAPASFR